MNIKARLTTKRDDSNLRKLKAAIAQFEGSYTSVGVHEDAGTYEIEGDKDPVPVSKVAWWLENGTQKMPARPFFYPTLRHYEAKIARLKAEAYASVAYAGETVEHALAHIGFTVQSWVQNTIKANVPPALSDAYLRRRQQRFPESGSRTLIASGLLLRSVRYKVSIKGGDPVLGDEGGQEPLNLPSGASRVHDGAREGGQEARAMAVAAALEMKAKQSAQKAEAKMNPQAHADRFNAQRRAFKTFPRRPK